MDARVYLHSPRSDFAATELLSAREYLGRNPDVSGEPPLRWLRCGCCTPRLARVRRSPWMRLLPLLRLYACVRCEQRVLHMRTRQRSAYGAVYLPAPPLRPRGKEMLALLARLPATAGRR